MRFGITLVQIIRESAAVADRCRHAPLANDPCLAMHQQRFAIGSDDDRDGCGLRCVSRRRVWVSIGELRQVLGQEAQDGEVTRRQRRV